MLNTSDIIRFKRNELGLSQGQLAVAAGVSLPTIQNIEVGKTNLSQATLEKVLEALGLRLQINIVDVDWDRAVMLGAPLTASMRASKGIPANAKEYIRLLDDFLRPLTMDKDDSLKNSRNWEALTALLWALDTHYPKTLKQLRYFKKAKSLLSQNHELFDLGRLIKLRRIAIANIQGIL